jgi:hypothetical protein
MTKEEIVTELRICARLLAKLYSDTSIKLSTEQADTIVDVNSMLRDIARSIENGQ